MQHPANCPGQPAVTAWPCQNAYSATWLLPSDACFIIRADCQTYLASSGLLHDTVEDTDDVSFEEIGQWFGPAVRRIVEGETRFSKIGKISGMTSVADVKAEDLRQLFLAMTEEVRIIVVKLADRLHNMRTLGSMKPEKQKKIAAETLQVCLFGHTLASN